MPGKYKVLFYEDDRGRSQVKEWLLELGKSNPRARAVVRRLLKRLSIEGPDMRPPMSKRIKGTDSILELRHDLGIRLYYWRDDETTFVVAAGELKKKNKADQRLIAYSQRAYAEWRTP